MIVSLYARGRDYHKVLRDAAAEARRPHRARRVGTFGYRVFTDSAPVLEVELAQRGGLGWRGKHTLLLDARRRLDVLPRRDLTDLPLPVDAPVDEHCGTCSAASTSARRGAIIAPYQLDARRCISYLTIEHNGAIPVELRAADRQPRLRLRRLPAGLPVEQVRAGGAGGRLRRAQRARSRDAGRPVRLERRGVPRAGTGSADPAHRLRTLAAQHRGRARQRFDVAVGDRAHCVRASIIRRRWCASTWPGRCASTARSRPQKKAPPWRGLFGARSLSVAGGDALRSSPRC